jgi:hypothetical protein
LSWSALPSRLAVAPLDDWTFIFPFAHAGLAISYLLSMTVLRLRLRCRSADVVAVADYRAYIQNVQFRLIFTCIGMRRGKFQITARPSGPLLANWGLCSCITPIEASNERGLLDFR